MTVQPSLFPLDPSQTRSPAPAPAALPGGQRFWVGVVSAEHVRRGVAGGFAQVCHGKGGPLRRLRAGDGFAYYSPTDQFRGKEPLQAFTAIGTVLPGEPYLFDMGDGFVPYRRNIGWQAGATPAPIRPLLPVLEFTAGRTHWGAPFRYGLFPVSAADFATIAGAMGADINTPFRG